MPDPTAPRGVYCLGLAVQDTLLSVPRLPSEPVKIYATARRDTGGGPAATAAVTVARLGGRAWMAGRLGEDATGAAILEGLNTEGVDTAAMKPFPGHASPASTVLVDDSGERLIVVHAPPLPVAADWLDPDLTQAGAVLCDLTWAEGALHLLDRAAALGLPRVLDVDVIRHPPETVTALLRRASHIVFSRRGLAGLSGTGDIPSGLAAISALLDRPALLGATDGASGLWHLTPQGPVNTRPPQVQAVDTTGAGDAFHGALAYGLACALPLPQAIRLAHTVAALKCTRPGGRDGLPTRAALAAFAPDLAALLP